MGEYVPDEKSLSSSVADEVTDTLSELRTSNIDSPFKPKQRKVTPFNQPLNINPEFKKLADAIYDAYEKHGYNCTQNKLVYTALHTPEVLKFLDISCIDRIPLRPYMSDAQKLLPGAKDAHTSQHYLHRMCVVIKLGQLPNAAELLNLASRMPFAPTNTDWLQTDWLCNGPICMDAKTPQEIVDLYTSAKTKLDHCNEMEAEVNQLKLLKRSEYEQTNPKRVRKYLITTINVVRQEIHETVRKLFDPLIVDDDDYEKNCKCITKPSLTTGTF